MTNTQGDQARMTPRQAEAVWVRFDDLLAKAECAIDVARRNVGRRNGFYSADPQLREARHQLEQALALLPDAERASEVLG